VVDGCNIPVEKSLATYQKRRSTEPSFFHYSICMRCGGIVPKTLKDRVYDCLCYGLSIGRDLNSSIINEPYWGHKIVLAL
jgi:hypothetical protein